MILVNQLIAVLNRIIGGLEKNDGFVRRTRRGVRGNEMCCLMPIRTNFILHSMHSSRVKKTDEYNWAEDAIASNAFAIEALLKQYLAQQLSGESAKKWPESAGR